MTPTQQPEALNLEEFRAKVTRAAREPLLSRIKELEAQLSAAQPAAQGLDAQTIKHISALSELVRMPNAEHFADAHNAAVRHLRVIAAQAKQGG